MGNIITLLSDLTTKEVTASAIKASLYSCFEESLIVDISHHIQYRNIRQMGYVSHAACRHFPEGTIHLLVNDISRSRAMLLKLKNGHYFIAPDNGILSMSFNDKSEQKVWLCYEFEERITIAEWMRVVVEVIKYIKKGAVLDDKLIPATAIVRIPSAPAMRIWRSSIDCDILHIDRYNNIVVNLTKEQFHYYKGNNEFGIKIPGLKEIKTISTHYNDVAAGQPLCRFTTLGYLEIAVNRSMPGSTGPGIANLPIINYSSVSIHFSGDVPTT